MIRQEIESRNQINQPSAAFEQKADLIPLILHTNKIRCK